jgi:phage portal protein, lambda family
VKYPTLARKGFVIPTSTSPRSRGVHIGAFNGGYEGASTGRRLGTWTTFASGPNLSDAGTLSAIRARARDAIRNNPWAAQALNSFAANLVGRGIVPRWKIENEELRQQIHSLWEEWVQESDADGLLDFYGQQTLVTKTVIHSGEAIIRFRPRRLSDGLSVPLQLQVLEPDFLDEYKDGPAPSGNTYHQGIEFNSIGQRVRYWLRKQHPGDSFFMSGQLESVPVPASQVLHVYRRRSSRSNYGEVSWFAPVLARMFLLDQYEDAELDRKKTAALFGVFITKSGDLAGPGGLVGFDSDTNVDANNRPFADLEPGMMNYLLPGEDVKFSTPADVGGIVRGVAYSPASGDCSGHRCYVRATHRRFLEGELLVRRAAAWLSSVEYVDRSLDP